MEAICYTLHCDSQYCPNPLVHRYPATFSFSADNYFDGKSFLEQCEDLFPPNGHTSGYCGQEFHSDPSSHHDAAMVPFGKNERLNIHTNDKEIYYEYRGTPLVQEAWEITVDNSSQHCLI